ncbi:MFS transporter [Actinoplanes sp. DH11]|uniref:MFS transporter n=1 Tax=Actinoplanes sp. DH11 TaxID=2857011 RepID=UPI001E4878E8|nr:MFS transporter [Actinoplanes sp. DH11]
MNAAAAGRGWWIVAAFAITQTIGYGTLYYAFAVLLHPVAAGLHTSAAVVTGAFTTAILAQAAAAVPVGRRLDRHGGRALMTTGTVLGAGMLVAWSQARTVWQLYLIFAGLGVAKAMALYEAATPVLVSWFDADRRPKAILGMIVVAGFASTIFMPLTAGLADRYGWRTTLMLLAALYAGVAVPLHLLVVRRPPAAFAATVAGLLGVLSVTGRLLLTATGRRLRPYRVVAAVFALQAAAALALPLTAGSRAGAVVAVTAFGLGFGLSSLAGPQLLADRYGAGAYAGIAGVLGTPVTLAKAGAPLAAAALLTGSGGDYTLVLVLIAMSALIAAAGILARATSPTPTVVTADAENPGR